MRSSDDFRKVAVLRTWLLEYGIYLIFNIYPRKVSTLVQRFLPFQQHLAFTEFDQLTLSNIPKTIKAEPFTRYLQFDHNRLVSLLSQSLLPSHPRRIHEDRLFAGFQISEVIDTVYVITVYYR